MEEITRKRFRAKKFNPKPGSISKFLSSNFEQSNPRFNQPVPFEENPAPKSKTRDAIIKTDLLPVETKSQMISRVLKDRNQVMNTRRQHVEFGFTSKVEVKVVGVGK
jgi:hypothetical protein